MTIQSFSKLKQGPGSVPAPAPKIDVEVDAEFITIDTPEKLVESLKEALTDVAYLKACADEMGIEIMVKIKESDARTNVTMLRHMDFERCQKLVTFT